MKVYLNGITGLEDAFESLLMSKRSWTEEKANNIRNLVYRTTNRDGSIREDADPDDVKKLMQKIESICKFGKEHITLLRYIDLSFTVEGLHRAGQDDWDSHAKRFDNRIIRASTRLARFGNEKSDFYNGKILTTDEAVEHLGIELPSEITVDGKKYVRCINGYVLDEYKDDNDVLRGLYMLSIPSNFIFKVNLTEFAHVYKCRNEKTHANPEVKELCEKCVDALESKYSMFNRELLSEIEN